MGLEVGGVAVGCLKISHRICSSILGSRKTHENLRNIPKIMAYRRVYILSEICVFIMIDDNTPSDLRARNNVDKRQNNDASSFKILRTIAGLG